MKETCRAIGMGNMFGPCTESCDVGICGDCKTRPSAPKSSSCSHPVAVAKETCRAFGMETPSEHEVLQSRGWLRSVHNNMGVDGDGRLWSSMT